MWNIVIFYSCHLVLFYFTRLLCESIMRTLSFTFSQLSFSEPSNRPGVSRGQPFLSKELISVLWTASWRIATQLEIMLVQFMLKRFAKKLKNKIVDQFVLSILDRAGDLRESHAVCMLTSRVLKSWIAQ